MSAADDRAVIAALRAGHCGTANVRAASGLSAAAFKACVQRLRYQGKVAWDSLTLTPSMIEQDSTSAPPRPTSVPAEGPPALAGDGEDTGAAPLAPVSEPAAPAPLLSAAEQLMRDIDAWCARTGTAETKLGAVALRHPGFAALLRKRMTATQDTIAKVRAAMAAHPDGMADLPMPTARICVPKGPKSESAARAVARAKFEDVATALGIQPDALAGPFEAPAYSGAREYFSNARLADHRVALRRADNYVPVERGFSTVAEEVGWEPVLTSPTVVELVTTAAAETVDDAAKAMARRWPRTWARVMLAARAADERPGETLIRLIEMGLAQVEAPRG